MPLEKEMQTTRTGAARRVAAGLGLAVWLVAAPAAEAGQGAAPEATAEDFAWLEGSWEGTGLGGTCEEIWSRPRAGALLGMFRLIRDGEPVFAELMQIARDDEGWALRVKHFTAGFTAWEEKDDSVRFGLESLEGGAARFRGLEMSRSGDRLVIDVRFRNPDRTERLEFTRRPLP